MTTPFKGTRAALVLLALGLCGIARGGVVFSEIHYHPERDNAGLEWIEIVNDAATPVDVSGYAFSEGIVFDFPPGTVLAANGFIVIASDAAAFTERYGDGVDVLGEFEGRLDNDGDRITIVNHAGIVVESIRYDDGGKWPTAPDGSGHTLAIRSPRLDSDEPESWTWSAELGGTPGAPNFPEGSRDESVVFNELFRSRNAAWVEVYNGGSTAVDMSGFRLGENLAAADLATVPAATELPPGGFFVFEGLSLFGEVRLFLVGPTGKVIAAETFERVATDELPLGTWTELRFPDGGELDWVSVRATPGAANEIDREESIVINEIMYHPPLDRRNLERGKLATRDGEYIELFNRGDSTVDLSGFAFDKGITYTFPDGTELDAGGYLVIAQDPEYLDTHYGVAALGPWSGSLANRGEALRLVDHLGNPVDRVRYHDGGFWPRLADGGGSSLELSHPDYDNSKALAWEPSDETGKAEWQEHRRRIDGYDQAVDSELNLRLAERGECLVDDIVLTAVGEAQNRVPNAGFENDTTPWRFGGTHVHSRRITDDARSGGACLHVIATGKGDTRVNRIEVDAMPTLTDGDYEISLWTRWRSGTDLLFVHGEYGAGAYPDVIPGPVQQQNLSGNSLALALRLQVPFDLGTPGAENSVLRARREATGSENAGPLVSEVTIAPEVPPANEPIRITARIEDPDGLLIARVLYRRATSLQYTPVVLFDDGAHGDGAAGDGVFGGEMEGQPPVMRIAFYIEAMDARASVRTFPRRGADEPLLFAVADSSRRRGEPYRLILDQRTLTELSSRELHSNDLLAGSFVFENEKTYYNVGTRYRGSPWFRPEKKSYRVRFANDDPYIDGRRKINLSFEDTNLGKECLGSYLVLRSASPGRPAAAQDFRYVNFAVNTTSSPSVAMFEPIDGDFFERWYGDADAGLLMKADGRLHFGNRGETRGWDGASTAYRGEDPENYRGYYDHSINESDDVWGPLVDFVRTLNPQRTPDEVFDRRIGEFVDLDSFFQVLAARKLMNDLDAFGLTAGHNGYLARDPNDGLWDLLATDFDFAFFNLEDGSVFSSGDPGVRRMLGRAPTRRAYLRALYRAVTGAFDSSSTGPFVQAVGASQGTRFTGELATVNRNVGIVKRVLDPFLTAPFSVVGAGSTIEVETARASIQGKAPVSIQAILLTRDTGAGPEELDLDPLWTTPTAWRSELAVEPGENRFEFFAFDVDDLLVRTAVLTVNANYEPEGDSFRRGDPNIDGQVQISDAIMVLSYLFTGGAEPDCWDSADIDDSGAVNLTDPVVLLGFLFLAEAEPSPPFEACGPDPTEDDLDCERYDACEG